MKQRIIGLVIGLIKLFIYLQRNKQKHKRSKPNLYTGKEKESNIGFESLFDFYEPSFEEPTLGGVNQSQCLHCQLSKTTQATLLLV